MDLQINENMKITKIVATVLLLASLMLITVESSAREVISINQNWGFAQKAIRAYGVFPNIRVPKTDEVVNLPHTWNVPDIFKDSYHRGPGTYVKQLDIPESYKGKRLFLKFEGAGTVTNVLLNYKYVGEHRGGYNAFTFEITDLVEYGKQNNLTVLCDNTPRFDVAPQGGDFNIYGGLYRDVWLLVMDDNACISPLYYGSEGVLISQKSVSEERAEISAEIHLSTRTDYKDCEVNFSILDATGQMVATRTIPYICNNKVICNISINEPHLWNGVEDPYLYKTVTILKRAGQEIDRVEESIGLRYFYVDANKGFFLNGKPLNLRGVNRHQDFAGVASALTKEHHLADFALFEEMGVNALRLSHYPQSKFIMEEADRRGFIVWEEIPFVGGYVRSDAFDDNLKLQLHEMIIQKYNHPSICFWGLFNEILGDFDAIVAELNDIAHQLDPGRLTTVANYQDGSFNFISDLLGWNKYFGWYVEKPEDFETFFDNWHAKHPNTKICVSEYGAGASIQHHVAKYIPTDNPRKEASSNWHPEERSTFIHMAHIKMITERDYFWGSFVWNMFDFPSIVRKEGDTNNQNDKGIITYDRKNRKDPFFLYKANWNKKEKTVHICSKRYIDRKEDTTDIIVFTTAPSAKLYINDKLIGAQKTNAYATIIWPNVKLFKGVNKVELRTVHGTDSCEWVVQ